MNALDDDLLATVTSPLAMSEWLGTRVRTAELIRVKAGRRCLVRYATDDGDLLGKVRVGHRPAKSYELSAALRTAGLAPGSPHGVEVAEPVAVIEPLSMWVQRVAPGRPADAVLLDGAAAPGSVGRRAAEAAAALHAAGVPPRRTHDARAELAVLERRLDSAAGLRPDLAPSLDRLRDRARGLSGGLKGRPTTGIHRDYYADQLILDGDRVTVIDLDLYCAGDPALDPGNFVAHLIELGVREHGDADHWAADAVACRERFLESEGAHHAAALRIYTELSLARLVALSVELPGRAHTTEALLDRCGITPAGTPR